MEIKFIIYKTNDGKYDIESKRVAYKYREGCYYYDLTADEVIVAIEDITKMLKEQFNSEPIFVMNL